jgi:hypothetical protein
MEYRLLGRTGVKVSGLCFGTMTFGGDADEAASAALFARCRDAGVTEQLAGFPDEPGAGDPGGPPDALQRR